MFLVYRKIFVLSRMLREIANPKQTLTQSVPDLVDAMEALSFKFYMFYFHFIKISQKAFQVHILANKISILNYRWTSLVGLDLAVKAQ